MSAKLFRDDNTADYTPAELTALNAEWETIVEAENLEPGSPESPGLRQYVCQPGSSSSFNAAQILSPGRTRSAESMSVARVCSVTTRGPGAVSACA